MLAVIVINLQVAVVAIRVGPTLANQVHHLPYLRLHGSEAERVNFKLANHGQSCLNQVVPFFPLLQQQIGRPFPSLGSYEFHFSTAKN